MNVEVSSISNINTISEFDHSSLCSNSLSVKVSLSLLRTYIKIVNFVVDSKSTWLIHSTKVVKFKEYNDRMSNIKKNNLNDPCNIQFKELDILKGVKKGLPSFVT